MAHKKDFELVRGDTFVLGIKLKTPAGDFQDLRGYKFYFTVKDDLSKPDDEAKIKVDLTVAGDEPVYDTILTADTSSLEAKEYFYDLQMKTPAGQIKTLLIGKIKLIPDVTYRTW